MATRVHPRASIQFKNGDKVLHLLRVSEQTVPDGVPMAGVPERPLVPSVHIHIKDGPESEKGLVVRGHPVEAIALATSMENCRQGPGIDEEGFEIWFGKDMLSVHQKIKPRIQLVLTWPDVLTLTFELGHAVLFIEALKMLGNLAVKGETG